MDADDLERAKIAVEEYKVLHAELLQRNNTFVKMIAASVGAILAILASVATGSLPVLPGVALVIGMLIVLGVAWKIVDSDARKASRRIGEIEEYVNRLVGGDNCMPLSWERRFGLLKRNYADRFRGDKVR